MTEAQWLAATNPIGMLEFLRRNPTSADFLTFWDPGWRAEAAAAGADRKFRLFACACCRRIWGHLPEACNRDAVAAVEDFLEGRLPVLALREALVASSAVEGREDGSGSRSEPGYWAVKYLGRGFYKMTAAESAFHVAIRAASLADEGYRREAERAAQAALLRCVFGNPFRPAPALSNATLSWDGGTVSKLASAIYEERAFHRLPVLADALEDAGCTDTDILSHCRSGGEHVCGCWVVDLVLGKA